MLKIRLQRVGRKNVRTFRVVLTDSKNSTKSGKYLEVLGWHNPEKNEGEFNAERITYWISKGAQPSITLHNMFVDKKIVKGDKVNALPKKTATKKEIPVEEKKAPAEVKAETPAEAPAETPAEAPAPAEEPKTETPA